MILSHLYSSILRGRWLIDLRFVDMSHDLLAQVISGNNRNIDSMEMLSDRKPFTGLLDNGKEMKSSGSFTGEFPPESVAVVNMHDTMFKYGTYCSYGTTEVANLIYEAANNKNISGVLLDVDSPGGCVDAVSPVTQALEYNRSMGKASVAFCDQCASAALYASLSCDEIVASNQISAEFGSVGVMMSFIDYTKYYENLGIKQHTIYSNLSDYKNLPFEQAKKGNYDQIKSESLDPIARNFQDAVKTRRAGKIDLSVPGIISGRMFYAEDALKYGMIDHIGDQAFAINRVRTIRRQQAVKEYIQTL